jgi:selenium metabolism protein YedF
MKLVDAKGKLCPLPLIMTKKALLEAGENASLRILVDNETSMKNVTHFLEDHRMEVKVKKDGDVYEILVGKTGRIEESTDAAAYCASPAAEGNTYVVAVQRDRLGDGDEALGKILVKAFINTLPEIAQVPQTIVFLNAGIFLALKDSPVIESLKRLEDAGVEILACGTCLDFYQKKSELGVGKVSNMYDILDRLSKAGKVIYP